MDSGSLLWILMHIVGRGAGHSVWLRLFVIISVSGTQVIRAKYLSAAFSSCRLCLICYFYLEQSRVTNVQAQCLLIMTQNRKNACILSMKSKLYCILCIWCVLFKERVCGILNQDAASKSLGVKAICMEPLPNNTKHNSSVVQCMYGESFWCFVSLRVRAWYNKTNICPFIF